MLLFSLCDIPFWLLWLLPLLLWLLGWWMSSNKYNKMVEEYEGRIKGLDSKISGLESDLSACTSKRNDLESDLALTKGRMREMESELKDLKKSNKGGGSSGGSSASSKGKGGGSSASSSLAADSGSTSGGGADLSGITSSLAGGAAAGGASASTSDSGASAASSGGAAKKSPYSGLKNDNLQLIEGIGPKMESVLKENGVSNFAELSSKSAAEVQAILDKYGDKYKIIDSETWNEQAKLANAGDWEGLISLQKKLDGGSANAVGESDSKLEKYLIKTGAIKSWKQDDLTEIEGIGPATDKLLRANGINTWRELANTDASKIKEILTAAGSRFGLSDPTTWPKQAELAADGEFDKLQEYQDYLDGGRG